jgi:hypothetical protein
VAGYAERPRRGQVNSERYHLAALDGERSWHASSKAGTSGGALDSVGTLDSAGFDFFG